MKLHRLGGIAAGVLILQLLGVPSAHCQCADATTTLHGYSTAIRLNGNAVRLMGATYLTGDYYNWWNGEANISFYFNSVYESTTGWLMSNALGTEFDSWYTPTLQTYGPGIYLLSTGHDAYTPYCAMSLSQYCNQYGCTLMPPWNTGASISVQRPGAPNYAPGVGHTVFYLGAGVTSDGQYSDNTALLAGNPNGAPETPQWVFVAGSNFGNLSCTNCQEPVFTATKIGTGCLSYDVVLKTSYNGFLSDPFWQWTNGPYRNIPTGTSSTNYDPDDPNHTPTNGYYTLVGYQTQGLCSFDAPLNQYDVNEQFGSDAPQYPGENWPVAYQSGQGGALYVSTSNWADKIGISTGAPGTPEYCGSVLCVPQFSNPGVGQQTLVDYIPQSWFVGGTTSGIGAKVQSDNLQRYTNLGAHGSVVSPAQ